ncbi:MAG: stage II sporulation protein M [Microscillaceae bacterium]|nr:stage II sporulation protein M [Microscillaceae bacterium]
MKEAVFIKKNAEKWRNFEKELRNTPHSSINPDTLAHLFIEVTNDLAYARTYYPRSKTTHYLNNLATQLHLSIYKNKKEKTNRFISFWLYELPIILYETRKLILLSFLFFLAAVLIGFVSTAHDDTFVRLILGDDYVNQTLENIRCNDPMAIYKSMRPTTMFLGITFNNIMVAFNAFTYGLLLSVGTVYILTFNGIMLGAFQFFFYQKGLLITSLLTIWIHGTLEIWAIIIAGAAGLTLGNSILFPETYSRLDSFKRGAVRGVKMVIGLVPIFIIAGFLESFVTRLTEMPTLLKLLIIFSSLAFNIFYFIVYPQKVYQNIRNSTHENRENLFIPNT